jgi:hypothetical protein
LTVSNINGDNFSSPLRKENIGKSTSGRTGIETDLSLNNNIGKDI